MEKNSLWNQLKTSKRTPWTTKAIRKHTGNWVVREESDWSGPVPLGGDSEKKGDNMEGEGWIYTCSGEELVKPQIGCPSPEVLHGRSALWLFRGHLRPIEGCRKPDCACKESSKKVSALREGSQRALLQWLLGFLWLLALLSSLSWETALAFPIVVWSGVGSQPGKRPDHVMQRPPV